MGFGWKTPQSLEVPREAQFRLLCRSDPPLFLTNLVMKYLCTAIEKWVIATEAETIILLSLRAARDNHRWRDHPLVSVPIRYSALTHLRSLRLMERKQ